MAEVMLSHLIEVPGVYDGTNDLWKEMTRSTHLHAALSISSTFPSEYFGCNEIEGSV